MPDVMVKGLLALHRLVDRHPQVHKRLAAFATRSVGEKRVNAAISELAREGDCVWDIGANIGVYTQAFLQAVGPNGHVVAFEPVPENAAKLRELGVPPRLSVVEAALSDVDGEMSLVVSGPSGETSHIVVDSSEGVKVRVARGDSLLGEGIPSPDVLKIDVEGFEGDVLDGLPATLPSVRAVVIEVHFRPLTLRGKPNEPLRITALLRGVGFVVRWIDTSHLVARRLSATSSGTSLSTT